MRKNLLPKAQTLTLLFAFFAALAASGVAHAQKSPRLAAVEPDTSCGALFQAFLSDERTSRQTVKFAQDKAFTLSNKANPLDPSQITRPKLLAMARDPQQRRILVKALLDDRRRKSKLIEEAIDQAIRENRTDEASQVYDVLFVGSGIHDQIANNILTNKKPGLKVVTVDEGDVVSSNFALAEAVFRINSTNRPDLADVAAKPGIGNLNRFEGGPVQVPDIAPNKFPPARALSDAATINRASAGGEILFKNRVVSVEDKYLTRGSENWPARYRVTMQGSNGQSRFVYSDTVVTANGIGKPLVPLSDPDSLKLIQDEIAKVDLKNPEKVPSIVNFEDAVRLAAASDNPYKPYAGQSIAVVGAGDSGKVFIEWLMRLAPEESYGDDAAQTGYYKLIQWIGQKCKSCTEYITQNRVRYAGIAAGLKNNSIIPVEYKLAKVVRTDAGRYKLTYLLPDGQLMESPDEVDRIIFATGFEVRTQDIFSQITPTDAGGNAFGLKNSFDRSNALENIQGRIDGAENEVTVGKRLVTTAKPEGIDLSKVPPQEVYFIGPASGPIVQANEQAGVTENVASIFALGPRTVQIANRLAEKEPRNLARFAKRAPVALQSLGSNAGAAGFINRLQLRNGDMRIAQALPYDDIYLMAKVNRLFQGFTLPEGKFIRNGVLENANGVVKATEGQSGRAMTVYIKRLDDGNFNLFAVPGLAPDSLATLTREIERDPELVELIATFIGKGSRANQMEIKLEGAMKSPGVNVNSTEINFQIVR